MFVEGRVGALGVLSPEAFSCLVLRLLDGFNDVFTQPFTANGGVIALDVGILLGLAGLYVFQLTPCFSARGASTTRVWHNSRVATR